jgi:hypothetical protein
MKWYALAWECMKDQFFRGRDRIMARPLRIEFAGAYYDVTARGDEQKDIFKSARDRDGF